MRQHVHTMKHKQGMTLVEMLVTIAVLSLVMASSLTLYSHMLKNIQQRDSAIAMLHDSDQIMTYIGSDIRNATKILSTFPLEDSQTLVTAMTMPGSTTQSQEQRTVVYSLNTDRPTHLARSIYTGKSATSTLTLSKRVRVINLTPKNHNVFELELLLEDTVAGEAKELQVSSAFALR